MIGLANEEARLELRPELGGAIGRFAVGPTEILRPTMAAATDPLDAACFPLVPFCNRIPGGRFRFDGRDVALPPNMGRHPHPLHGQGWRAPWRVEQASAGTAKLAFDHADGDWPWRYRAFQYVELSSRSVRVTLSVTNLAETPMPAALGFHPYFPRAPDQRLKAEVSGVWLADDDQLPVRHHAGPWRKDWNGGDTVEDAELIDHCHTGWAGQAELTSASGSTRVTASPNCRWLHVYAPPRADFFCVEPVGNMPDPFGGPDRGITRLAPGESLTAWMQIAA
jgi:aldose 1-epimerase